MKASKDNKVYTITEAEKAAYLDRGYTVLLDDGTVEVPASATVPVAVYRRLAAENASREGKSRKAQAEKDGKECMRNTSTTAAPMAEQDRNRTFCHGCGRLPVMWIR